MQAALLSYHLDYKGVDSTLKTTPEVVDEFWANEAERLIFAMLDRVGNQIFPPKESGTVQ